ncbi:DtxR family transcriptional regulator [Oscillospiraceae bacterium CM]|nr:DtxR family transcriptional regulator [Oscillospiraceae bacterium CM]
MKDESVSDFRTVRGYQLLNRQVGNLTPAMEDYLEMTYRLCLSNSYARVGQLSELLNVRPPSASKMISKLTYYGYLKYDRYGIIQMTELGLDAGSYLLKRHETVENFLRLIGNLTPLKEAELIEHSLSPETVNDLNDILTFFQNDDDVRRKFLSFKEQKK